MSYFQLDVGDAATFDAVTSLLIQIIYLKRGFVAFGTEEKSIKPMLEVCRAGLGLNSNLVETCVCWVQRPSGSITSGLPFSQCNTHMPAFLCFV